MGKRDDEVIIPQGLIDARRTYYTILKPFSLNKVFRIGCLSNVFDIYSPESFTIYESAAAKLRDINPIDSPNQAMNYGTGSRSIGSVKILVPAVIVATEEAEVRLASGFKHTVIRTSQYL
ncbi:hypothetical protein CIHG_05029 [Coccidioides immitis H538.4]|uniref:Uncharacterized protein n=1 Tax=Coccidioides immitis H538.4 TaxID=396776 RepID=A0A0J8RT02_COCIT|nr:hypothetical protein CIHG_05029 [Coccidioides immitis H538.4]